jgi:hypothetical protein
MGKNANFTGQPVFSQLLNHLPSSRIRSLALQSGSERYVKHFKTYDHLVSMLYSSFHNCRSLREVVTGMMACHSRLVHLGLHDHPKRSTLSDANKRRDSAVFEQIYYLIYRRYRSFLSDSRSKGRMDSRLFIVDSTTISLFQEILKNAGTSPMNGKRKGGIKAHVLMRADQDVPCLVRMTSAATNDSPFLKEIQLPKGSVLVFDRGYRSYEQYQRLNDQNITWITRKKANAAMEVIDQRKVSKQQALVGVVSDERVILGNTQNKKQLRLQIRRIVYKDQASDKTFEFLTNNTTMKPSTIAQLYERRWQIELLFKRLKQNNQLTYFLGDNENAIRIQIWCAMIADLIIKVIQRKVKRSWSFSNLASMLRIHLMSYTSLIDFLENPDRKMQIHHSAQLKLFSSA